MGGICEIEEIEGEEWVVFNSNFNQELTPDIIQFLSKHTKVQFNSKFNRPVDISDKEEVFELISAQKSDMNHEFA